MEKIKLINPIFYNLNYYLSMQIHYQLLNTWFNTNCNKNDRTEFNILITVIYLLNYEPKDLTDRPLKQPSKNVIEEFKIIEQKIGLKILRGSKFKQFEENLESNILKLKKLSKNQKLKKNIENFVDKNFLPLNFDSEIVNLEEKFLDLNLKCKYLTELTKKLHIKWKDLIRKYKFCPGSTLLYLPFSYVIPGDRFRECFYWDTYFTIEGLIVSGYFELVIGILKNFIYLINNYGFIPNGTRTYYLSRSQPPFFALMLELVYEKMPEYKDLVLNNGLSALEIEYEFWIKNRTKEKIDFSNINFDKTRNSGTNDSSKINSLKFESSFLARNYGTNDFPRINSIKFDRKCASKLNLKLSEYSKQMLGIVENGHDFTSRFQSLNMEEQIPVDLNVLLYKNEMILSNLFSLKGNLEKSNFYLQRALYRETLINTILWNPQTNCWADKIDERFVEGTYFTNFYPIFFGITPPINFVFPKKYFLNFFGIPSSLVENTNQQWDFPQVWAPHQYLAVKYFLKVDYNFALKIAQNFVRSVWKVYMETNEFYEKYSVDCKVGNGGEYVCQKGFGWTNGVVLYFISVFKDKLIIEKIECTESKD